MARLRYELRSEIGAAGESRDAFLSRCTTWMHAQLGREGAWRAWVAEVDGELAGNLWLQILQKLPNPVGEPERHGYISSFYVKAALRGHGIGSGLFDACMAECERVRVDAMILWPTPRSRSLYARYGFIAPADILERRGTPPA